MCDPERFLKGTWVFVSALSLGSNLDHSDDPVLAGVEHKPATKGYLMQLLYGVIHFVESIWLGTRIVLGHRHFVCTHPRSTYMHL